MAGDNSKLITVCTIWFFLWSMSYSTPADIDCDTIWADNLEEADTRSTTVHLTLLHREHPCSPASMRPVEHSSPSALSRYHNHIRRLAGSISSCPADEVSFSGPIIANGVPWDYFSYVTQIQLGSPAKTHSVLVDTGSSLPWIMCKPCKNGCEEQVDPLFDPGASSTYKVVGCWSSLCRIMSKATMSRNTCFWPYQSCTYNQTYEDNTMANGVASFDRMIFQKGSIEAFLFGCTDSFSGLGGQYSGIIGLSANSLSFFSQVSLGRYKAMSYCFPHPREAGFLRIGQYDQNERLRFSPLFIDGNNYYVHISSISVGNDHLDVSPGPGDNQTMRCSFDTGTPYTMLPSGLFESLSAAVEKKIQGFYRVYVSTGQTCFEREMMWNEEDVYIPTTRITFNGGAMITLVGEDIGFSEGSGLMCLAIKKNAGGDVVLGSRHLMAIHTVIDLENSTLGLQDRGCT